MEKDDSDLEFAPIAHRTATIDQELDLEAHDQITRIASSKLGKAVSALSRSASKNDPRLDPTSPEFDHYRWAQTVLEHMHEQGLDPPRQGIVFRDLSVSGSGAALQYQETLVSSLTVPFRSATRALTGSHPPQRRILQNFDGLLESGELLLVLGRPGSGCTTFLKTVTGHMGGLAMDPNSTIHYQGISYKEMIEHYRGEVAYNKEVYQDIPQCTQT
jgi:ATP-binding cassette, subfamily G (WHITE), member 2, PDR